MKKIPENLKTLRSAVLTEADRNAAVFSDGMSKKAKKKAAKITLYANSWQPDGYTFMFGVDPELPDAERVRIWREEGLRCVARLESAGFAINREMFATDRDGRIFFVRAGL